MYKDWSTDQGDYINNHKNNYRKEELANRRRVMIKKVIKVVAIYTIGFLIYFLIIKWI